MPLLTECWPRTRTPAVPRARPGEVHVWWGRMGGLPGWLPSPRCILTAGELAHAECILQPRARSQYLLTRSLLRLLLAQYVDAGPRDVKLELGANGKPRLGGEQDDRLAFNVTHSGDVVVVAVAGRTRARSRGEDGEVGGEGEDGPPENGEVGVDVEQIRADTPVQKIAARFFAPLEVTRLLGVPEPGRRHAFFQLWSAKEALLKAMGDGLTRSLDTFVVEVGTRGSCHLLGVPQPWTLVCLDAPPGYVAAVAYGGAITELRCFEASA